MNTDSNDLADAVALLEREFPDCAWSATRITNPRHSDPPEGPGAAILLHVSSPNGGEPLAVWEKHPNSFLAAAERATTRMHFELQVKQHA
ncbi:hypothetical protein F1643_21620 [Azospirillum sp. INR13]|uniref:hypothetical protein n=1 Tax=Azospirillum sp. INR13 TaxID=2596919 RepID=UPI0018920A4D|nr:hypothetical protein [Azospirillum sp. INR13]MBF5096591.1 hypothetical protein [Azospirillum sp. INR13]